MSISHPQGLENTARMLFHGDGYNRWFDKGVSSIVTPSGVLGANVEHTPLDATVSGQMWEYALTAEQYDADGKCVEMYPGEKPLDTPQPTQSVAYSVTPLPSPSLLSSLPHFFSLSPFIPLSFPPLPLSLPPSHPSLSPSFPYSPPPSLPPSFRSPSLSLLLLFTLISSCRLKWKVEDIQEELAEAQSHLAQMIQDSDLRVISPSYGKAIPKKAKLSPDGWFQVCMGGGTREGRV